VKKIAIEEEVGEQISSSTGGGGRKRQGEGTWKKRENYLYLAVVFRRGDGTTEAGFLEENHKETVRENDREV